MTSQRFSRAGSAPSSRPIPGRATAIMVDPSGVSSAARSIPLRSAIGNLVPAASMALASGNHLAGGRDGTALEQVGSPRVEGPLDVQIASVHLLAAAGEAVEQRQLALGENGGPGPGGADRLFADPASRLRVERHVLLADLDFQDAAFPIDAVGIRSDQARDH